MDSSSGGTPLLVCTACGKPQAEGRHLCEHCGAPLTPFAHTDWLLGVQSRGFAARQATTEPRKLIVVVGMWLWMLPMLVVMSGVAIMAIMGLREAWVREPWMLVPCLFMLVLGAGMACLAATILFRTTRSFLVQRGRPEDLVGEAQPAENKIGDLDSDPTECLGCGQTFPADADCCPTCGWSYSSENERAKH